MTDFFHTQQPSYLADNAKGGNTRRLVDQHHSGRKRLSIDNNRFPSGHDSTVQQEQKLAQHLVLQIIKTDAVGPEATGKGMTTPGSGRHPGHIICVTR